MQSCELCCCTTAEFCCSCIVPFLSSPRRHNLLSMPPQAASQATAARPVQPQPAAAAAADVDGMSDDLLQPEGGPAEAANGGHAGPSSGIAARLEALRREAAIAPSSSAAAQPSSRHDTVSNQPPFPATVERLSRVFVSTEPQKVNKQCISSISGLQLRQRRRSSTGGAQPGSAGGGAFRGPRFQGRLPQSQLHAAAADEGRRDSGVAHPRARRCAFHGF